MQFLYVVDSVWGISFLERKKMCMRYQLMLVPKKNFCLLNPKHNIPFTFFCFNCNNIKQFSEQLAFGFLECKKKKLESENMLFLSRKLESFVVRSINIMQHDLCYHTFEFGENNLENNFQLLRIYGIEIAEKWNNFVAKNVWVWLGKSWFGRWEKCKCLSCVHQWCCRFIYEADR